MTASRHLRTLALCALVALGSTSARAVPHLDPTFEQNEPAPDQMHGEFEQYAQADCSAAAAQAAAQTGGQVLSVQASNQGGQTVCVVTVLIPGQGGERPRRTTITIPG